MENDKWMKVINILDFAKWMFAGIKFVWDKCYSWLNYNDRKLIFLYLFIVISVTYVSVKLRDLTMNEKVVWRQEATALLKPYLAQKEPVDDFRNFPCFPGLVPASMSLQLHGKCVRMLDRVHFRLFASLGESCKYLQMGVKTPICSYKSVKSDKSDYYSSVGLEDKAEVESMLQVLKSDPNMTFLDIGTNDGVYCIAAAKANNKTICLDENYENLQQIVRSLFVGNIWLNAMYIWNKLSNKHETVKLEIPTEANPIEMIDEFRGLDCHHNRKSKTTKVNTVTLNDLQGIAGDKHLFIKFDLGSDTVLALEGSKIFFKTVDVRIVQLVLTGGSMRFDIIDFLHKYGLFPFSDVFGKVPLLSGDEIKQWPKNVYFIKKY